MKICKSVITFIEYTSLPQDVSISLITSFSRIQANLNQGLAWSRFKWLAAVLIVMMVERALIIYLAPELSRLVII